MSECTRLIEAALASIPCGRVSSYGRIALLAGFPRGARQVVRVLHSRSRISGLPWHRVLAQGPKRGSARIALLSEGFEEQRQLLLAEGVEVSPGGIVDLERFGWP